MRARFRRLSAVLLLLVMVLASAETVSAKDVSGNWKKGKKVAANKMVSGTFEKKNDKDCYYFISGGGSYTLYFYSKELIYDPMFTKDEIAEYEAIGINCKIIPVTLDYYKFMKFSSYQGQKPTYQPGPGFTQDGITPDKTEDGWYCGKVKLGKSKKNQKVGLRLTGLKKADYKFKIVGKKSPGKKK